MGSFEVVLTILTDSVLRRQLKKRGGLPHDGMFLCMFSNYAGVLTILGTYLKFHWCRLNQLKTSVCSQLYGLISCSQSENLQKTMSVQVENRFSFDTVVSISTIVIKLARETGLQYVLNTTNNLIFVHNSMSFVRVKKKFLEKK